MNFNFKRDILPILENLSIPNDFYDDSEGTLTLRDTLEDNFPVITYSGLTKLVCVFINRNYVIKIPFNKYLDFDDDKEFPVIMTGATGDHTDENWDYCSQEIYLYNLAKMYHVEKAFPETIYIGKYHNWPIYLQEKCYNLKNNKHQSLINQRNKKEVNHLVLSHNFPYINENWLCLYYLKYGEQDTIDLLTFIKYYKITDLHSKNIGFSILDDRPVLIDFAGFNEYNE